MVDDDDNLLTFADIKKEKKWKPESVTDTGDIRFAISTGTLDQKIIQLEELMNQMEDDEIKLAQFNIDEMKSQKKLLSELLEILPTVDVKEFNQLFERDLANLSYVERWKVYSFWRAGIVEKSVAHINLLNVQVNQQTNEMKDVESTETAEIIREAHIVGITTTGAAKQRALLEHLQSKIGSFDSLDWQLKNFL